MKKITLPEINNHLEIEDDTIFTPEDALAYEIASAERKNGESISLETLKTLMGFSDSPHTD